MAGADLDFNAALQAIPGKRESLLKAVSELNSQRNSLPKRHHDLKELEAHFADAEKALRKRYQEYLEKEKAFEAKRKDVEVDMDVRDMAVTAAEQASLVRVQEEKDGALADVLDQRRKWNKEPQLEAMELDMKGVDSEHTPMKMPENGLHKDDTKVDTNSTAPKDDIKPRPELTAFCRNFDGHGIQKFIADNRKDSQAIRLELPAALKCSIDPERLVLEAIEGSFEPDRKSPLAANKKDPAVAATRRACIIMLESLADVLADPVLGVSYPVVSPNIKEAAKAIADDWKSKINFEGDAAAGFPLDAQSFLQLVATFGLASAYDQNELSKLVLAVSRRKQTPSLCGALGLTPKIPDIIDMLIKDGKFIEAVSFAHEFSLFDHYEPVSLLKSYVKEVQKASQVASSSTPSAQKTAASKELSALRAVLKCIDEYKLEDSYPSADLQTRVSELEKTRDEKKRTAGATFFPSKKSQMNTVSGAFSRSAPLSKSILNDGAPYRASDRAPFGGVSVPSFGIGSQHSYDRPLQGRYASSFSGGARSPAPLSNTHVYPAEGLGSTLYGSAYTNPSSSYSSYQYGTGLPLNSAYRLPYMH